MIVTLLIASLNVVLRIIRQTRGKERGKLARTMLLQKLESTTMNELPKLTTQHYAKNEAGGSLLSKVTKILSGQRVATKFQQPQAQ